MTYETRYGYEASWLMMLWKITRHARKTNRSSIRPGVSVSIYRHDRSAEDERWSCRALTGTEGIVLTALDSSRLGVHSSPYPPQSSLLPDASLVRSEPRAQRLKQAHASDRENRSSSALSSPIISRQVLLDRPSQPLLCRYWLLYSAFSVAILILAKPCFMLFCREQS